MLGNCVFSGSLTSDYADWTRPWALEPQNDPTEAHRGSTVAESTETQTWGQQVFRISHDSYPDVNLPF